MQKRSREIELFLPIHEFLYYLDAQENYHRELKSHAQTVQNFDKYRELSSIAKEIILFLRVK